MFFTVFKNQVYDNRSKGFTLIELIVSIGLFSVVSTLAVGSILVLVDNNRALRSEQSTITNVSFALDAMTRDIRMGYDYNCISGALPEQQDCPNGGTGISFIEGSAVTVSGDEVERSYFYDEGTIFRQIDSNPEEAIVSSAIRVTNFEIFVTGTSGEQPVVTIYMQVESESGQRYDFQTSVTQRFLNI